jgi:hypothetical protein
VQAAFSSACLLQAEAWCRLESVRAFSKLLGLLDVLVFESTVGVCLLFLVLLWCVLLLFLVLCQV